VHVREPAKSITAWTPPVSGKADLRDVRRLIGSARQGVLYLANRRRIAALLSKEILRLGQDKDLFVEGLLWSPERRGGGVRYASNVGDVPEFVVQSAEREIDSTIVLVDPFGPHPVVITGSHDLSEEASARNESDLLIVENVPTVAAEYAVQLLGLFDRYRFRSHFAAMARRGPLLGLQPTDQWQDRYFIGRKRREFNFLFGSLSPGLDF
jgi:hypothetical protein